MKNRLINKLKGLAITTCATAVLLMPNMVAAEAATSSKYLSGKITVGLLFDETVTDEMKTEMLSNGGTILKSDKGEMYKIPSVAFEVQLVSKNGKYSYKTYINEEGDYSFSDVKTGKYDLSLVIGEKVLKTQEITINKGHINDLIVGITLDEYLNATMHQENEEHNHENHEEATIESSEEKPVVLEQTTSDSGTNEVDSEVVSFSHKYPYMPCLDYNGWYAPDSRHVHDWSHFFGSDCFLAAWYPCSGDHQNVTEYCDGTTNCSHIIGHKSSYHAH